MSPSATAVGTASEKRCEELLLRLGYSPVWRVRRTRFGNMDFFGLFDVVALWPSKHPAERHMRFIQVKTNRVEKKTIEAIGALRLPIDCSKEVWVWKSKTKEWVITKVTDPSLSQKRSTSHADS